MDVNKAYEVEQGLLVENGPFYTGGASSPVGLDLPTSTFYLQTSAGVVQIWLKFGSGVNDWKKFCAQEVLLNDNAGYYHSGITSVEGALRNIREQRLSRLNIIDTDVESSHILTATHFSFHKAIGSGSGFYFQLPDATTLIPGQEFEFANESTNSIEVRDGSGAVLATVNPLDISRDIVTDTSTIAGNWVGQVSSTTATGITSYSVGSTTAFTTSSTTDTIITGITVTPASGRYGLWFSSSTTITNNNAVADIVAYQGGSALEILRREVQGVGANFVTTLDTVGELTVDGTEEIDIRVSVTAGSVDLAGRRLLLIRLGA